MRWRKVAPPPVALLASVLAAAGCGDNGNRSAREPDAVAVVTAGNERIEIQRDQFNEQVEVEDQDPPLGDPAEGLEERALNELIGQVWTHALAAEEGIKVTDSEVERFADALIVLRDEGRVTPYLSGLSDQVQPPPVGNLDGLSDAAIRERARIALLERGVREALFAARSDEFVRETQMRLRAETECLDPAVLSTFCRNGPPLFDEEDEYAN